MASRQERIVPRQQIVSDRIGKPSGHFSQAFAVEARGRFVFISGMTAKRTDGTIAGVGDIETQTRQMCYNVKAAVEAAGGTMADICRVDVYVKDMTGFDIIHRVRREFFPNPPPASTLVAVSGFVHPDYLIEMSAIAVITD
jgi:2-iminobutanoate/2-iminopropanoate deaminase